MDSVDMRAYLPSLRLFSIYDKRSHADLEMEMRVHIQIESAW